MKSIDIYARGIADSSNAQKEGKYVAILHYRGIEKLVTGKELNTTSNRILIKGLIDALKLLKEPCEITVYTHCNFGINKEYSGINKDLTASLLKSIELGGHKVNYVFGNERQRELINKLKLL